MDRAVRFQFRERANVGHDITRCRDSKIIATQFTLRSDLIGNPPYGRMIEERSLGNTLENVHQVVEPSDVRQFMDEQYLHLRGRKTGQRSDWYENHRTHPANYRWDFDH